MNHIFYPISITRTIKEVHTKAQAHIKRLHFSKETHPDYDYYMGIMWRFHKDLLVSLKNGKKRKE